MAPLPEILTIIGSRVAAKLVGRSRSVSKAWRSVLTTTHFIVTYLRHALQNPNLLLLRSNNTYEGIGVITFDGQMAAPQGQLQLPGIIINAVYNLHRVESSSHGLLLISLIRCCTPLQLLLLNPLLGRMRTLPAFPIYAPTGSTRASFCLGFDPTSNDYKVISFLSYRSYPGYCDFVHDDDDDDDDEDEDEMAEEQEEAGKEEDLVPPPIRAEIFSLRSGTWKELSACDIPRAYYESTPLSHNGSFYWLGNAFEEVEGASFVLSFDMKTEVFTKSPMPGAGAYSVPMRKQLAVYNDSLTIIIHPYFDNAEIVPVDLWFMKDWCWTKLYSFGPFVDVDAPMPLGLWRNEVIIQFGEEFYNNGVFSYNCDTGERKYIVVPAEEPQEEDFFYMERLQAYNYVESLVDPLKWGDDDDV